MAIKNLHRVFSVVSTGGLLRVLKTTAILIDPITQKTLPLEHAVWDTGATSCAIHEGVANLLGLVPTGQTNVHTANGITVANTYLINLILPNGITITDIIASGGNLGPDTQMLIGMDVISIGDFVVENCSGSTRFAYCVPAFENKYDMLDKANTVNNRIAKQNARTSSQLSQEQ